MQSSRIKRVRDLATRSDTRVLARGIASNQEAIDLRRELARSVELPALHDADGCNARAQRLSRSQSSTRRRC
jgi:hypothetical protein